MSNPIRVISYNVLSPDLATPTHHVACEPELLDDETRFQNLLKLCHAWVHGQWEEDHEMNEETKSPVTDKVKDDERCPIICLQEVSQAWMCRLRLWFEGGGMPMPPYYRVYYRQYGWWGDGTMGVLIAVPTDVYEVLDWSVVTPGATLPRWPRTPRRTSPDGWTAVEESRWSRISRRLKAGSHWAWRRAASVLERLRFRRAATEAADIREEQPRGESSETLWRRARERKNAVIMVHVRIITQNADSFTDVIVATYHMPCAFRTPALMAIHATRLMQIVHGYALERAGNTKDVSNWGYQQPDLVPFIPYLVAGDFNIQPGTDLYKLFTGEATTHDVLTRHGFELPQGPQDPQGLEWEPTMPPVKYVSAYAAKVGSEPTWTNSACNPGVQKGPDGQPAVPQLFQATLDYIWVSPGLAVHHVLPLPIECYFPKAEGDESLLTPEEALVFAKRHALPNADHNSDHVPLGVVVVDEEFYDEEVRKSLEKDGV